jgi:hypothetical protein
MMLENQKHDAIQNPAAPDAEVSLAEKKTPSASAAFFVSFQRLERLHFLQRRHNQY